MAKKKYGFWSAVGDITGALLAPATFGASMVLSPTARGLVGNVLGDGGSDNDNSTQQLLEQQKLQNEQFNTMMKQNREELEKIRSERAKKEKKIKDNDKELDTLKSKLNNPDTTPEEKERIKKQIILLETDNKQLKEEIKKLIKDEENKEKDKPTLPNPSTPWKLPKLSMYDKALIAGIVILIIYFLFLKEDKKK